MKFLTNEQQESYEKAKICYIYGEKFEDKYANDNKYPKVRQHYHYNGEYKGAAHSVCNLKYSMPKEMIAIFHNGSSCDFYFIRKEVAGELERQLTCLGQNNTKYRTFSVPVEKEVNGISKNAKEITKIIHEIYENEIYEKFIIKSYQLLSLLNYVPYVLPCPTCLVPYVLRALRALVSHALCALHAFLPHVPRSLRALVPYVPRAVRALVPYLLLCLPCLLCLFPYVPCDLRVSYQTCSRVSRVLCAVVPHVSCALCVLELLMPRTLCALALLVSYLLQVFQA